MSTLRVHDKLNTPIAIHNEEETGKCIHTADAVHTAIARLAMGIRLQYQDAKPVILVLLEGARVGANLLEAQLKALGQEYDIDYMKVSSYGKGQVSGTVELETFPSISLEKRDVLLFDDLLDTGKTLLRTRDWCLQEKGASTVTCAVVFKKMHVRTAECENLVGDLFGLSIPDVFVYGTGLDNAGVDREKIGLWQCPVKKEEHVSVVAPAVSHANDVSSVEVDSSVSSLSSLHR